MKKLLLVMGIIVIVATAVGYYLLRNQSSSTSAESINAAKTSVLGITEKPEDTVKKLDEAYWQAVKFNDYASAYDFFQPSDKELISKETYVKKQESEPSLTVISDIKIEDVRVERNTAVVRVMLTSNTGQWPGTDNYSLIDGKWYRVMSNENKEFLRKK